MASPAALHCTFTVQVPFESDHRPSLPTIATTNKRHPFPFAIYVKTRADANLLCEIWADFLDNAQPFPRLTVHGGTSVFDIASSNETSPVVMKLRATGHAEKFDEALQHCKPIFALPYAQYPGLYVDECVHKCFLYRMN